MTKVYEDQNVVVANGDEPVGTKIEIEINGQMVTFTEVNRYPGVINYKSAEGVELHLRTM